MSDIVSTQANSLDMMPLNISVNIDGQLFEPEVVEPPTFSKRMLGKIGLSGATSAESQQISDQRRDFFYRVTDHLNRSSFSVNEVVSADIQLTAEDYGYFGFKPETFTDSVHEEGFHKENDPSLDVLKQRDAHDWYRVVDDKEGQPWFLKTANKMIRRGWRGLFELGQIAQHLPEVFAARVAGEIGYPVPETRPVFFDGKPWVASKFIEDHQSYEPERHLDSVQSVSNPAALTTRYLFNALIGSWGDCSNQGIIDPVDKKYYAQDVSMDYRDDEMAMTPEELTEKILRHFKGIKTHDTDYVVSFGNVNILDDKDKEFARSFLTAAQAIDEAEAAELFAYGRARFDKPDAVLQHLKNRATALLVLLNSSQIGTEELVDN